MAATVARVRSPTLPLRGACLLLAAALGSTLLTSPQQAPEAAQKRRTTVEATTTNTTRRTLAVTSEGLAGIGAAEWQAAGHRGAGTKVAIIDLGFDGWEALPADELPAATEAIGFNASGTLNTGTDHGTQMAEIIHDVAPEAELVLITFDDDRMGDMVTWLLANDVDVVSFSMEWTDGPLDGTHWTAPIIQASIDAGVTWVVAAGNSAQTHHNGTTMDVDGDGWIEVTSGGIEQNEFVVEAGDYAEISLSWNNPATDLDLCLFDMSVAPSAGSLALLECTENLQGSGEPPTESLTLENLTGVSRAFGYGLIRRSGPDTTYEARTWKTGPLAYANPAASIGVPGNMADVITVGAVAWDSVELQPYSAWGPNHMGDRKPEVVGPDEITTSGWAGTFNTGTSYAAPHVAGLVALMLGAAPVMSPDQVKQRITERATRADTPDFQYGWGVARLGQLPSSIAAIRGHWAEEAIDWAFTASITDGCPTVGELTCPELAMTRDEMAQFMWRFWGLPVASSSAPFGDVPIGATYGPAVDWLAEAEVTLGCTPVEYCPDGTTTRAEMATFLWRLEGEPSGSPSAGFDDVANSSFAVESIDWLLESGITVGCSSTSFCPLDLVTRAEMFTFLQRLETATT